jgi:hypothetical protein
MILTMAKKKLFFGSTLLYNNMKTLVTFVGAADNVIELKITIIVNIAKKQNKTKHASAQSVYQCNY